jgi:adenosylmethionine-8-amino-7-oxononanoate aminotransferase
VTVRSALGLLEHLETVLMYEGPETVAAVRMEAMIGGSGMIVYPDGYLRGVREICDRHGIALIFDEGMTGSAGPAPGSPASTGTCCRT